MSRRKCGQRPTDWLDEQAAIEIGIYPAAYRGEPGESGKSPWIGQDGCWVVYDDEKREWVNTGVRADGSGDIDDVVIFDGGNAAGH